MFWSSGRIGSKGTRVLIWFRDQRDEEHPGSEVLKGLFKEKLHLLRAKGTQGINDHKIDSCDLI